MVESWLLSTRSRIAAPLAVMTGWFSNRIPARAQEVESRHAQPSADALTSLLSLVPADFSGSGGSEQVAMFADIAAQLAIAGVGVPDSIDDEDNMPLWINAVYPLAIASPFATNALRLKRSLLGFDITDIAQTLEFGLPPNVATLVRGRFDRDAVAKSWSENDYKLRDAGGVTVASLHEDAEMDLASEIGRIALARMNNAAFLSDGTLVYAPTLPLLSEILETANGTTASLAKRVDVEAILQTAGDPLASAILFGGVSLSVTAMVPPNLVSDPDALEGLMAQLADPAVPPIAFGLIGMTPGGPTVIPPDGGAPTLSLPPAAVVLRLLMVSPGSAETASAVIDARLRSMSSAVNERPYSELFSSWSFEPNADGSILSIELIPGDGVPASIWLQIFFQRDLLFLAW